MSASSISKISLGGRVFFVKRDDLIDPFLAGNKYRKLYSLLQTPKEHYTTVISYGGTQSNAMLAIASLCKSKNWKFIYYSKPISEVAKNLNTGNFFQAKNLGMIHEEIMLENYKDFIASLRVQINPRSLLLDQGASDKAAKLGLEVLAKEIRESKLSLKSLATPSGTGTTSLYLALALPEYKVYTTACIGGTQYLKEQMSALAKIPDNLIILEPSKKYHFAKPYPEFFTMYKNLLQTGIEFDLLYAPLMFQTLLEQVSEDVLYIHSGGVSGNESMLKRYERKGLSL
jgi:1-aminocyclopropane-1-carboxylate deaminase/D-cysteine desulfhydrase-like pyridoxal-dependent ACC family enzyme